jgi:hypothetical protein
MNNLERAILCCIDCASWTPQREVITESGYGSWGVLLAKLNELVERREIWRSYEASMAHGKPVLAPRYCIAHEVGDPPIGKRVQRTMVLEMAE